jgi:ubiquitin-like-conjugating enzyme ATG10
MSSVFPHLTDSEFEDACNSLQERFHQKGTVQSEWLAVEHLHQHKNSYLSISKPLPCHPVNDDNVLEDEEIAETDEETLINTAAPQPTITYDIILSPTYSVPVLYISIRDIQHRYPPTMATLYECLVPAQFKAQTENVGVMGGITITDHPVTSRPVFFIHPCRTAEVMEASMEKGRNFTAEEYLIVWMGALGKSVGLNIPLALAAQYSNR